MFVLVVAIVASVGGPVAMANPTAGDLSECTNPDHPEFLDCDPPPVPDLLEGDGTVTVGGQQLGGSGLAPLNQTIPLVPPGGNRPYQCLIGDSVCVGVYWTIPASSVTVSDQDGTTAIVHVPEAGYAYDFNDDNLEVTPILVVEPPQVSPGQAPGVQPNILLPEAGPTCVLQPEEQC